MNTAEKKLRDAWSMIFPSRNRNAGGAQLFHWASENAETVEEFDAMNKLYCGVSGSFVRAGSVPEAIQVKAIHDDDKGDGDDFVCGDYYRCCWPCVCDVQKYARAEPLTLNIAGVPIDRMVLTIPDPCRHENLIPRQVSSFLCDDEGRSINAVVSTPGRIVIAAIHEAGDCNRTGAATKTYKKTQERCDKRDAFTSCELGDQGGMGDIFAKLACIGSTEAGCEC